MNLAFCPHGGWTVSTDPVPADPADHWVPSLGDFVGCNRLLCPECGAAVRSAAAVIVGKSTKRQLTQLAQSEDWSTLPFLRRSASCRVYACQCRVIEELSRNLTEDPDPNPMTDRGLPWRCAGHPSPTLPLELDGVPLHEGTDWGALVQRTLGGVVPDGAPLYSKAVPAFWVGRLYYRLRTLPEAVKVSRAVGGALTLPEPESVGAALWFFRAWPHAPGSEAVEALAARVGPTTEFPVAFYGKTTPTCAALALAARARASDAIDPRVRDFLREAILAATPALRVPDRFDELLQPLARHDGAWVAKRAAAIAGGEPARAQALLRTFRELDRDELIVVVGIALLDAGGYEEAVRASLDNPFSKQRASARVLQARLDRSL